MPRDPAKAVQKLRQQFGEEFLDMLRQELRRPTDGTDAKP
jgi:hypothetical protein